MQPMQTSVNLKLNECPPRKQVLILLPVTGRDDGSFATEFEAEKVDKIKFSQNFIGKTPRWIQFLSPNNLSLSKASHQFNATRQKRRDLVGRR
jgi:hypothetical protein